MILVASFEKYWISVESLSKTWCSDKSYSLTFVWASRSRCTLFHPRLQKFSLSLALYSLVCCWKFIFKMMVCFNLRKRNGILLQIEEVWHWKFDIFINSMFTQKIIQTIFFSFYKETFETQNSSSAFHYSTKILLEWAIWLPWWMDALQIYVWLFVLFRKTLTFVMILGAKFWER